MQYAVIRQDIINISDKYINDAYLFGVHESRDKASEQCKRLNVARTYHETTRHKFSVMSSDEISRNYKV